MNTQIKELGNSMRYLIKNFRRERIEAEFVLKMLKGKGDESGMDLTRKRATSNIQRAKEMIRILELTNMSINELVKTFNKYDKIETDLDEEFNNLGL